MKKFLLGLFVGLILAGLTLFIGFFAALRLSQKPPTIADGSTLILRISGEVPERPSIEIPLPFFEGQASFSLQEYWELLRKAAADPHIKAVVLMPEDVTAGWAKLHELHEDLLNLKRSGKPVVAFLKTPGTREYFLATAADRIYMSEEDVLYMKGLRAELMFVKGTLDKLGVKMEIEHAGKYKDAGDMFTRTSATPETREVMNSVLDGVYGEILQTIAAGRKKTVEQIRAAMDDGPFLGPQAVSNGLIDQLQYEDQVYGEVKQKLGQNELKKVAVKDYMRIPAEPILGGKRKIALLVGEGAITRNPIPGSFGEEGIAASSFIKQIRKVGSDASIRGVILRIDSPGGDAIASDEILREVKLLSKKKPLVISMSDLAASGGYFIAMSGDPILAYPNTLTGSIGVIFGKPILRGLYDKIGVTKEAITRGRFAGIDSDYEPLTDEGRAKLRQSIDFVYRGFLDRVAQGRKKKVDEIEPLAQGRVWLGSEAKGNGLVDEIGGLDRAIELIKQKAQIPAGEKIILAPFPEKKNFIEALLNRSTEAMMDSRVRALLSKIDISAWEQGGILKLMPYRIEFH